VCTLDGNGNLENRSFVGVTVGEWVKDEASVGISDAEPVGLREGAFVGFFVGISVGEWVEDGASDGISVAYSVGIGEGGLVGSFVGVSVGDCIALGRSSPFVDI